MDTYKFLLDLALILFSTKILGLITSKFYMPQVVGALLAGLILGPGVLDIISQTDFINKTAEVGVIVLMFCAGLETDVQELKNSGKSSFVIALIGVVVPLAGGYAIAALFNKPGLIETDASCSIFLQNIFIGVILTATSVSITVEALKEIGKLKTKAGNAILGAAVIDDILGIIALTFITSMADSSINIWIVLLKIIGFFIFVVIAGFLFYHFFIRWSRTAQKGMRRHVILAFVFCLLMSYAAEEFFGVADITGAYIAGIVLSLTPKEDYIMSRFNTLSFLYLSPIFFASIGIKVALPSMSYAVVAFSVILTIVALLTKMLGCGLGAKACRYENCEALQIGVGMISRGEVALIVANKGQALGLMDEHLMGPIVIMVIITTIITPILLKPVFRMEPRNTTSS